MKTYEQRDQIKNPGLIDGRMGLCVNLYEAGRFLREPVLTELADTLIDELCDPIDPNTSSSFNEGTCGIGWGLQHLSEHKFIEGDMNEVLSDIDARMFKKKVFEPIGGVNLETGMLGLGSYFVKRIQNSSEEPEHLSVMMAKQHLINIVDYLDWYIYQEEVPAAVDRESLFESQLLLGCLLYEIHRLDIYNSRVNKAIVNYLRKINYEDLNSESDKLQQSLAALKLKSVCNAEDHLPPSLNEETLVQEVDKSNGQLIFKVTRTYYDMYSLTASPETHDKVLLWKCRAETWLKDKNENEIILAGKAGLLNGFSGYFRLYDVWRS